MKRAHALRVGLSGGICMSMLLIATLPASAASGGSAAHAEPDEVVAGAALTLASGRVLDESGAPVSGAQIEASAYPDASVMGALKVGDSFSLIPIATTTSGKDGTFTIPAAYQAITAQMGARPSRPVNIQIVVNSPEGSTQYAMPVDLSAGVGDAVAKATDVATVADASVGSTGLWLDLTLTQPPLNSGSPAAEGAAPAAMTAAAGIPSNCTLVTDYGPRWVVVGQTSATTGGHTQKFTFSTGASSSLGVGYSLTGAYGSFSSSGTQSWSSTTSIGFPTYSTSGTRLMKTQYRYAKVHCYQYVSNYYYYNVVPTAFVTGSTTVASSTPTANYCASFSAGSTFTKSSTSAVTYSSGVSISNMIGINLSARTGFTGTAKLYYTFSSSRHLCGKSDYPGGTPYQLVVKP